MIAFRDVSVGADTANYYRMYSTLAQSSQEDIEIGYILLNELLNLLSKDPRTLFVLQGLLVAISYALFVIDNTKKTKEAYIAIIAFLAFNLFSFHLSGVRQSIAMCICLFAYKMVKQKKPISFLLIVAFASLFHMSAVFFFPAYLIARAKGQKAASLSVLGTVLGIVFMDRIMGSLSLLNDRFSKYGIEETDNGYIFFAVIILITVFDAFFRGAIIKNTTVHSSHSKLNYCNAGMWVMRLFTRVIERISFFYMPASVIVVAHTYGAMKTEKDKQIYTVMLAVLLTVLYLYRTRGLVYAFC